jgi:hypothetical protein
MTFEKFFFPVFLLAASALILSSCTTYRSAIKDNPQSACNDSLYIALQKRDSSTFSPGERAYFNKIKKECTDEQWQAELADTNLTTLLGLGSILLAAGIAIFLAIHFPGKSH